MLRLLAALTAIGCLSAEVVPSVVISYQPAPFYDNPGVVDGTLTSVPLVLGAPNQPQYGHVVYTPPGYTADALTRLGTFRTFQVPVLDIATLTALDVGPLGAADVMRIGPARQSAWIELSRPSDIRL